MSNPIDNDFQRGAKNRRLPTSRSSQQPPQSFSHKTVFPTTKSAIGSHILNAEFVDSRPKRNPINVNTQPITRDDTIDDVIPVPFDEPSNENFQEPTVDQSTTSDPVDFDGDDEPIPAHYPPKSRKLRSPSSGPLLVGFLFILTIAAVLLGIYFFQFYYPYVVPRDDYIGNETVRNFRRHIREVLAVRSGEYQCQESTLFYMTDDEIRSSLTPSQKVVLNFDSIYRTALESLQNDDIVHRDYLGYTNNYDTPIISTTCKFLLFWEDFVVPYSSQLLVLGVVSTVLLIVLGAVYVDEYFKRQNFRKQVEFMKSLIKRELLKGPAEIEKLYDQLIPPWKKDSFMAEVWKTAKIEISEDPSTRIQEIDYFGEKRTTWHYVPYPAVHSSHSN